MPVALVLSLVVLSLRRTTDATWAAATPCATAASTLALAAGRPVMTLGGFTGGVPCPTLAAVQSWVRLGRVRYGVVSASALAAPPTPPSSWSPASGIVR